MRDDGYHEKAIECLQLFWQQKNAKGYIAISGYECELYDELYADWYCHHGPCRKSNMGKRNTKEMLWTNYQPNTNLTLF